MSETHTHAIAAVYTSFHDLIESIYASEISTRTTARLAVLSSRHPTGTSLARKEVAGGACTGLHLSWSHIGHGDSHVYFLGTVDAGMIDQLADAGVEAR